MTNAFRRLTQMREQHVKISELKSIEITLYVV